MNPIYHLTQDIFYADPKDSDPGYLHTFNILYTISKQMAIDCAERILKQCEIKVLPNETVTGTDGSHALSYRGGEGTVIRPEDKLHPGAVALKLEELNKIGHCTVNDGEYMEIRKVEMEREYENFYNKTW